MTALTIAVCLKASRRVDVPVRLPGSSAAPSGSSGHPVSVSGNTIRPDGTEPELTPVEGAVFATALALRSRLVPRPEVLALSVGPAAVSAMLRDVLAAGADRVLRVWPEGWEEDAMLALDGSAASVRARSWAAAEALRPLVEDRPVLILAGEASTDEGHGAFGAFLAYALELPWIHRAAAVEPTSAGWALQTKLQRGYIQEQKLEGGSAVVTFAAQGDAPPTASWPAWLASRRAPVPSVTPRIPDPLGSARAETVLRPPVPRVKRYTVPNGALSAEQRIRALIGTTAQGSGMVLPEAEGTARQVEAMLELLRARGHLPGGPAPQSSE